MEPSGNIIGCSGSNKAFSRPSFSVIFAMPCNSFENSFHSFSLPNKRGGGCALAYLYCISSRDILRDFLHFGNNFQNCTLLCQGKRHWRHLLWFTTSVFLPFSISVRTQTAIVFLLIFWRLRLFAPSSNMPSRHFSWKQQVKVPFSNCSLLTGLLTRRENYDFFASRHGSNFLHGCPFRLSSYLSGLEILLGFGNCLAEEWSRKISKVFQFPVVSPWRAWADLCCYSQKIFDTLLLLWSQLGVRINCQGGITLEEMATIA